MEIRYPDVTVKLVGEDGNIFNIVGLTSKALRRQGVSSDEIRAFQERVASTKSYDEALQEIIRTVNVG